MSWNSSRVNIFTSNGIDLTCDEYSGPRFGDNSTKSIPTIVLEEQIRLNRFVTPTHERPPGSGAPVAGMTDGSKTSKSKDTYTFCVKSSQILSISDKV